MFWDFLGFFPDGFQWKDGSPVSFLNWNKGEPSDAMNSTQEECVEMYTDNGKWNDVTCFTKRRYTCKQAARKCPRSKWPPTVELIDLIIPSLIGLDWLSITVCLSIILVYLLILSQFEI